MIRFRIAVALGLIGAVLIWLYFHDRAVIRQHEQKREAAAQVARDVAADERVKDAVRDAVSEKGLHDAIQTGDPRLSLACERLRRLGRVSTACGPESRDGSQAVAGR